MCINIYLYIIWYVYLYIYVYSRYYNHRRLRGDAAGSGGLILHAGKEGHLPWHVPMFHGSSVIMNFGYMIVIDVNWC